MRKVLLCILYIYTLTFGIPYLFAVEGELHSKIVLMQEATAPHVYAGNIFFSYKPTRPVRYVAVAFAHEDFRKQHIFQRNDKGVFFLAYPIPSGLTYVEYRYIIDGLWTIDPLNPLFSQDLQGITLSRFEFPPDSRLSSLKSPVIYPKEQRVVFTFTYEPGQTVYVTGSFSRWDPFLYPMQEVRPGVYTLSLRLLPGTYFYTFYTEGRRIIDPLNPEWRKSPEGHQASLFIMPLYQP
ncbi:MAG: hypothetical protein SNJ78_10980 [Spirochaetales bacterium]